MLRGKWDPNLLVSLASMTIFWLAAAGSFLNFFFSETPIPVSPPSDPQLIKKLSENPDFFFLFFRNIRSDFLNVPPQRALHFGL